MPGRDVLAQFTWADGVSLPGDLIKQLRLDQMDLPQVRALAKSPDMVEVLIGGAGVRVTLNAEVFDQPDRVFRHFAEGVPGADLYADDSGETICVNHGISTSNEDAVTRVSLDSLPGKFDAKPRQQVEVFLTPPA
jgi:hypothetical protein